MLYRKGFLCVLRVFSASFAFVFTAHDCEIAIVHPTTPETNDSESHSSADRSPPRPLDKTRTQSGPAPSRSPVSSPHHETPVAPRSTADSVTAHSSSYR